MTSKSGLNFNPGDSQVQVWSTVQTQLPSQPDSEVNDELQVDGYLEFNVESQVKENQSKAQMEA